MEQAFLDYLKSIGLTSPSVLMRVKEIYDFVVDNQIIKGVTDILVEDYVKKDGTREYNSLDFFSEKYCMSAEDFLTKDDFRIVPREQSFNRLVIEKESYDFKKATEKSRLTITVGCDEVEWGEFKASKENCDHLRDIARKYFMPK